MSKFQCGCGFVMVFQTDSLPYDMHLIPDRSVTELGNDLDVFDFSKEEERDKLFDNLLKDRIKVMDCPNCDRIYIETEVRTDKFNSYIREFSDIIK